MLGYMNDAVNDGSTDGVTDNKLGAIAPFLTNLSLHISFVVAVDLYPVMEKGQCMWPFPGLTQRGKQNERPISNMRSFSSLLRFCLSLQGNSVRMHLPRAANQLRCPMYNSICLSNGPRKRSFQKVTNPSPMSTSYGSDSATEETT